MVLIITQAGGFSGLCHSERSEESQTFATPLQSVSPVESGLTHFNVILLF